MLPLPNFLEILPMKNLCLLLSLMLLTSCCCLQNKGGDCPSPRVVATVEGMTCEMCASTITAALKQNPNVKNVKVDVAGKTVTIDLVSGKTLDKAETERIIKKAGYTQTGFKSVCR